MACLALAAPTAAQAQEQPAPVVAAAGILRAETATAAAAPGAAHDGGVANRSRGATYVHDLLGPGALAGIALGAAWAQWRDDPEEWGTGASGYGRRAASSAGALFAQETVRHGLAAALGRSTEYQLCACHDFGGRVGQAFVETFTDRDARAERHFSVPRVAGALAGGFAPLLWTPHMTGARGLGNAAGGLALTFGGNLLSEFVHWSH